MFSENIINVASYILRDNVNEENVKAFSRLYGGSFKAPPKLLFVYVNPKFDLILQKMKERFSSITSEQSDRIEKDVRSNVELFETLLEIKEINDKAIIFRNHYDESTMDKISNLCEVIKDKCKD